MVVEKVRLDSLQPGTSVLSLLSSSPLITGTRLVPILTADNTCIGFILEKNLSVLKKSKYFNYTKVDKNRVLKLKGTPVSKVLEALMAEQVKKGISFDSASEQTVIFTSLGVKAICSIPYSLAEAIGAKTSRIVVIAHVGRDRNMSLLMGRRLATAISNPSKLQCFLSFPHTSLTIGREDLAEVACKTLDLQPAFYSKLKSSSVNTTMLATERGLLRTSIHKYELDLTDIGTLKPRCPAHIEQFETIPVKTVLDSCHAGMICQQDIAALLEFCVCHGVITPETEEEYLKLCQILSYDIPSTFPCTK